MILARCPACATVFRASADQLKLRDGMVRCGRCRTAFNALSHVVHTPPLAGETLPTPNLPDTPQQEYPSAGVPDEVSDLAPDSGVESAPQTSIAEAPGNDANDVALPAYELPTQSEDGQAVNDSAYVPQTTPSDELTQAVPQSEAIDNDRPASEPAEVDEAAEDRPAESDDGTVEEDSREMSPAQWPSTLAWGSALALAGALALLQLLYLYRSDIAHADPGYRPMIESLCEMLDCRIELPQQAELIGIEVSDLQPDPKHKERLVLATTLKNRAGFAQAYPHIELTLTDSRDRALARRVFPPDVYLSEPAKDEAGFAANAEQTVRLVIDATGVGAAGYRMYIFYP